MITALAKIPEEIENLIINHKNDLEDAWANIADGELVISFSAKVGIKNGKGVCEVGISFTKDKVRDSVNFNWDDKQLNLLKVAK